MGEKLVKLLTSHTTWVLIHHMNNNLLLILCSVVVRNYG